MSEGLRRPGRCPVCNVYMQAGAEFEWLRTEVAGKEKWSPVHPNCLQRTQPPPPTAAPASPSTPPSAPSPPTPPTAPAPTAGGAPPRTWWLTAEFVSDHGHEASAVHRTLTVKMVGEVGSLDADVAEQMTREIAKMARRVAEEVNR